MLATDINMLFACALSSSHTNQLRERWKDGRKGGGKKGKEDREKENASGDGKREREREREPNFFQTRHSRATKTNKA